ncbi:hypothetical protein NEUTE1DRAFT_125737 [Neurospora tetrasperma FGSC 2508]|uniref:SET domain-containing protein n=1 Tax=Neurospora tetrasperma (strain FGSC 2508 / ATCC MYA-4615 / P0657) TaxID=510951 RepID=F8N0W8_NEUT8|nr:uncharacterized protein NEUTE1DRAFT_125737 [Neurospora tetrasperma FGSC 2508]EGO52205.1 hypothetical protein NEUTE1DRAFT_125737 [Neurospora tetrasperma FGSC 2508]
MSIILPARFLRNAPKDAPAVRIGLVGAGVGYGLFAARDFTKDEFIFHEAPLMTALFNEKFSADASLMHSQYQAYKAALADGGQDIVTLAFPMLAARNGIPPASWEDAGPIFSAESTEPDVTSSRKKFFGRNLVHGRFAGSIITREEYETYVAGVSEMLIANPTEEDRQKACLDFFKHYAFQVKRTTAIPPASDIPHLPSPSPPVSPTIVTTNTLSPITSSSTASASISTSTPPTPTTNSDACIYLLGSLINHCCTSPSTSSSAYVMRKRTERGPNCEWRIGASGLAHFVKPKHICVQAKRDIKEGEQLTWDYGKKEKGFVCECATCRGTFMGYCCGVL